MSKWVRIGVVGINSATLFIGDPAQLCQPDHPLNKTIREGKIDWRNLFGSKYPVMRQLGDDYGVISSTGWGDGIYEVEARIITKTIGRGKNSSTTSRVAELRIVFIDDDA